MAGDFKWSDLDEEDIVTPSVQAVAVYVNTKGSIVIRQQRDMREDDDVIVLPVQAAERLIQKLGDMIEMIRSTPKTQE
jgi:hypothetical protein